MTSTKKNNRKRGEEKKSRIRDAAYRCFREKGYYETTVDEICRRASCSKGSFYWYYNSKQEVAIDILKSWAREVITELLEQFEDPIQQKNAYQSTKQALKRELHRGRAIVPLWLEFSLRGAQDEAIRESISKFFRRARTALSDLLSSLVKNNIGDEQLFSLASTIFGAYIGLLVQELADPKNFNAEQIIDDFMLLMENWLPALPLLG